ncbi:LuxR C-terminal-related transcriptional regulator, partial [Escherichia coli]|uniref:LuxR C-terminal-related transcriptional regulator n=1 Tax=Escherichia coli TaxID=562 RepID=UPI00203E0542
GTVCVVGKIRDLILQLSKSSIYSTKPLSGYTFFPSETLNYIKSNKCSTNSSTVTVLSNREVTILRYLVSGLSNKEIADKLLLSNKTVSAHKSNIYGKLGLHSIVELIDYAKLYELI